MKRIVLTLLATSALPLLAQSVVPGSAPAASTIGPAPQRGIMPLTLNHKPNATQPPAEVAKAIDAFFKTLQGDPGASPNAQDFYEKAYGQFLAGTMLGDQKQKASYFVSKTQEAFGIYGPLKDAELFDNYSVGSNILVLTYLSRHSVQPLLWRFIYYRPDKSWKLINLGFGDNVYDLLD